MGNTSIEWTSKTWNPIRGCSVVSSGCKNCYAMNFATRFAKKGEAYEGLAYRNSSGAQWTGEVRFIEKHLTDPLKVRKPAKWFVNSMSDLFHESIPDEWIDRVFAVMALAPWHTYQVLTKRPERMRDYMRDVCSNEESSNRVRRAINLIPTKLGDRRGALELPLFNVWMGVSVEDQKTADERIPTLIETPAAVRWISAEPLLEPIDLQVPWSALNAEYPANGIHWVVVGGESGQKARGLNLDWPRSIVSQCKAANVPVFVKQLGAHPFEARPAEGRDGSVEYALAHLNEPHPQREWFKDWTLITQGGKSVWVRNWKFNHSKGGDIAEWPEDLRIREFPK